jgi:predicted TIM-barrel fold metal-dependent hydrolase
MYLAIFSADRCFFASKFPVDSLATTTRSGTRSMRSRWISEVEQRKLFHDKAADFYRLET